MANNNNMLFDYDEKGNGYMTIGDRKYRIAVMAKSNGDIPRRWFVYLDKTNFKDEKITIEFTAADWGESNKLWDSWAKNKLIKKSDSILFMDTYVDAPENRCYRGYDPTIKLNPDRKNFVCNFDWFFSVSEDSIKKLLDETERRFLGGIGYDKT